MINNKILLFLISLLILSSCWSNTINNTDLNWLSKNNIEKTQITNIKKQNLLKVWVDDFKIELEKKDYILIDLRTTEELKQTWVINWSKQIDFYSPDFEKELKLLDNSWKYLIYCRSGSRSWKTLNIMKKLWFKNVYELEWGINDWFSKWENTVAYNNENKWTIITLDAKKWEYNLKEIKIKKWEKLTIKVNNLDGLHWIAIPDMELMWDNEIEVDTSNIWKFEYRCMNYCWSWHQEMKWILIIE